MLDCVNDFVRSRLRRLRLERGLKVTEAAEKSGMPVSSYACLESGTYRISLSNLSKMLRALEADINEVWPAEDFAVAGESDLASAKRTQVFRFNEVLRLTGAEGAALFEIRPSDQKCTLLYHQHLSDFLLDRLILYLEEGREYEKGVWFWKENRERRIGFFLKTSLCESYLSKLIADYMTIWMEVF